MTGGVGSQGRALDDRTRVACDVARTLYEGGRHGALGAYLDNLRASDAELADVVLRYSSAIVLNVYRRCALERQLLPAKAGSLSLALRR